MFWKPPIPRQQQSFLRAIQIVRRELFLPVEKSFPAYLPLLNWKTFYEFKTVITDLHRPRSAALLNNSRDDKSLTELNGFSATPLSREKLRDGEAPTWPTHSLPSYRFLMKPRSIGWSYRRDAGGIFKMRCKWVMLRIRRFLIKHELWAGLQWKCIMAGSCDFR